MFHRLITLEGLQSPPGRYDRLWNSPITLWYFIWQCLQPSHTLQAVVRDARRGGADGLCRKSKTLSTAIGSKATTAYSDARQRLPLEWMRQCFEKLALALVDLTHQPDPALPLQLLDGSTKRLRPHGDIPQHFPAHRTRRKTAYWCVARVLISFCAHTGIAMAGLISSIHVSEQAMAVQLMLAASKSVLYIADRNFGVWRVVRAAAQSGGQILVRLTTVRARRLWGKKRLPRFVDLALLWTPSSHDQVDPGLRKEPVSGRLLILQAPRPGFRPQVLYLFTTLTDLKAYPPQRLLELYGWRWRAELHFREVKSTLQMDQSETKSAQMVRKEFYAGLMAYNLVRGLMATAAAQAHCLPSQLSFGTVHGLLASMLTELFMTCVSLPRRHRRLLWLLGEAAAALLPRRRKPRPSEPRAQNYEPQVFPKLQGSRDEARRALQKTMHKT